MREAEDKASILLVSTADWDNPFWTNKQHVAVEFARRGHRVLYIESQGLRAPAAKARDLRRIVRRLRRGLAGPRRVRDGLWVVSPLTVPLQRFAWVRRCNRLMLRLQIGWARRLTGVAPTWLWTYSPLTTELYDLGGYTLVVYHAVDDIKAQPGMPRRAIEVAEAELSRRADLVFTTSPRLEASHRLHNPRTHLFPNVADFGHFSRALQPFPPPRDIEDIPEPRIGFIGAVSGYKVDFALLRQVADLRPRYSFVLIGRIGEGDPSTDVSLLRQCSNIHLLGPRSYRALPNYLGAFAAAMLPSPISEYTASMFPMKVFEYLAAGRAIVATRLPALATYADLVLFADDAPAFAQRLDDTLAGRGPPLQDRLAAARGQTYETRTGRMFAVIAEHLQAGAATGDLPHPS